MPPLCPKLLLLCGNLTPALVPSPTECRSSPTHSPNFPFLLSFLLLSFVWIHIPFQWSGTPASSQLVLCEILASEDISLMHP